jgi:hypothetical protein
VAEDARREAHARGYAANDIIVIRTDGEFELHARDHAQTRFYKPRGCVTLPPQQEHRMVLTSVDYFESERIPPKMYEEIRNLARGNTTLFIGSSLQDFTFRNIFYRLYAELGQWTARSYSVAPVHSEQQLELMTRSLDRNFNTTVLNDGFDTFLLRLAQQRGTLRPRLQDKVRELWDEMSADNAARMDGLSLAAFES